MVYTLLLLSTFVIIVHVYGKNYCQICTDHTLCLYNSTSSECNRVLRKGVSAADITTIVDEHNKHREKVSLGLEFRGNPGPQPPAYNMSVLVWDNEIASIAQMWVEQCMFGPDTCRNTNGTYVGQNLYLDTTSSLVTAPNWTSTINAWYEEVPKQNKNQINPFVFNTATGHYTQLVWGTTEKVGCGFIAYQKDNSTHLYYACNYSPGGNIVGASMYQVGIPCIGCPLLSCSLQYLGLCNE